MWPYYQGNYANNSSTCKICHFSTILKVNLLLQLHLILIAINVHIAKITQHSCTDFSRDSKVTRFCSLSCNTWCSYFPAHRFRQVKRVLKFESRRKWLLSAHGLEQRSKTICRFRLKETQHYPHPCIRII